MSLSKISTIALVTQVLCASNCIAAVAPNATLDIPLIKQDISAPLIDKSNITAKSSTTLQNKTVPPLATRSSKHSIPILVYQGLGAGLGDYKVQAPYANANGSVGQTQYVQVVNNDIGVFDKSIGQLLPGFPVPVTKLFKGFDGPCEDRIGFKKVSHPIVKYDQLADRWFFAYEVAEDPFDGPFMECIAVSRTNDAAGSYNRYQFAFNSLVEQGKVGLWPNAYFMTFNLDGPAIKVPIACALNRTAMLKGKPPKIFCRQTQTLLPVDLEGTTLPPVNTPGYFIGIAEAPIGYSALYKFYVNFDSAKDSYLDGPYKEDIFPYGTPSDLARQPGSNMYLHIPDDYMNRATYRQFADHASLLVSLNKDLDHFGGASEAWIEWRSINGELPKLFNRVSIGTDTKSRYLGSVAMDKFGNIGIGYNVSSRLIYPSIEIAYQNLNANVVKQPAVTGLGSQSDGVWAQYSSMAIDPVDDCTFWYTNQYQPTPGNFNWSTAIVKFKLQGCTAK